MDLKLESDDLNACVQCGLCLPSCPTFRVTGEETMSPRGRIQLMREVHLNDAPLTREVLESFESCVQCRGCEPACPSSVPFGVLMEKTRETLASEGEITPKWQRFVFNCLTKPKWLRVGKAALALTKKMRLLPSRFAVPDNLPPSGDQLHSTGTDVYLFTGCIMDVLQRESHRAAQRVITAAGFSSSATNELAPCCGAVHAHAGLAEDTRTLAQQIINNLSDDNRPILVDSAGCGAAMKDYGRLLNTDQARNFSDRVFDIHEWLENHLSTFPVVSPLDIRVAIQDPCHLRHVQNSHEATRVVLKPFVRELVELDDEGLCCGAGGFYSVLQPDLAADIRQLKLDSVARVQPDVVASANPGCSMYLGAAGIPILHPVQLVDAALNGFPLDV